MPDAEHAHCRFEVMPSGTGKPATLQIEFIDRPLSVLKRPTQRLLFGLRPGMAGLKARPGVISAKRAAADYESSINVR
jgi:hypothetical protein